MGLETERFPPRRRRSSWTSRAAGTSPHVIGLQVGQPLEVRNSDGTLHNVHAVPKVNREFNFGQPTKGMKSTRTFDKVEVMVPFRCDVHGWMNAYAGVLAHPFFAVSKADGTFEIKGLPPGSYTVEVWHEQLGTQTTKVTVDAKDGRHGELRDEGPGLGVGPRPTSGPLQFEEFRIQNSATA